MAVGANILLTVLDGRVAVQGVEMREAELLVIRITKIEILDEWVVSHRAFGGVFTTAILIPDLVEGIEFWPVRHQLLVWDEQSWAEIDHAEARHLLEFDVGSASAIAGAQHQSAGGGVIQRPNALRSDRYCNGYRTLDSGRRMIPKGS